MKNTLMLWPKSANGTVHVNYHLSQFGEVVNYLNSHLQGNEIIPLDCDFDSRDVLDLISSSNISKVIMNITYENVPTAFELAKEIKGAFGIPIMAPMVISL